MLEELRLTEGPDASRFGLWGMPASRRQFLKLTAASVFAAGLGMSRHRLEAQEPGERPKRSPGIKVVNPRARLPLSFIIDDSTCLVNLAHFCIPQFAEVFPDRYKQPWRSLPREIPDSFVQKFNEWCAEKGVKGKYSVVPYPALVGWLDRDLPGWSHAELESSLKVVRDELSAHWDFHPEMVTHTWVINTKTGRPYPERTAKYMENWGWSVGRSVEELTDYMAYALRILRNVDIHCEGITTPGGFGSRALPELAQATLLACRDVFNVEIPHYFRHLFTDERSVQPRVEYAADLDGSDPRCVVSIIGCTGDWFGGWDGLTLGSPDKFITADLERGRLVEVLERGEPAVLVCHWPGIYFNGLELGFNIFKSVVKRLEQRYDNLIWMKLSELARYWAARELTGLIKTPKGVRIKAPFACPEFTIELTRPDTRRIVLLHNGKQTELKQVHSQKALNSGTWLTSGSRLLACFDLPKGTSELLTT